MATHPPRVLVGAYLACMQYTLRNVPPALDRAIRERARREGKSLNEVAVDALWRALGFDAEPGRRRSLSDVRGSWVADPEFDAALAEQDRVDASAWR